MLHFVAVDLRRHPGRTLLTASGVAIGVAMIVALLALSAGIERSASGLIHLGGSDLGLFQGGVGELTASSLPQALAPRVRAQSEVADAAPIAVATGTLPALGSFLVFGVDPRSFVMRRLVFVAGRRPAGAGEAAAGEGAARQLGLRVGGLLALQRGTYRVVGIYHTGTAFEDQGAVLPLVVVERLLGRPGDATTIAVTLRAGADPRRVGAQLERSFPGTVAISQPGEVARVDTNTLLIRKAAVVFVALALVIGGIAVMNTMLMAVFERQRDFALLLAIGWPRRLVGALVLREGIALSFVGALAGLALGAIAVAVVVRALGASTLVVPHLTAWTLARALLVALAMGALGSLYPAWRVTRLRPAEALG